MQRSIDDVRSYCWLIKTRQSTCSLSQNYDAEDEGEGGSMCAFADDENIGKPERGQLMPPKRRQRSVSPYGGIPPPLNCEPERERSKSGSPSPRQARSSRSSFRMFRLSWASKSRGKSGGDDAFSDVSETSVPTSPKWRGEWDVSSGGGDDTTSSGGETQRSRSKGSLSSWLLRKFQHHS